MERHEIIGKIKKMIFDYNKQFHYCFLDKLEKKMTYCFRILKNVKHEEHLSFSDFMYKRLWLSENNILTGPHYILTIDEILNFEKECRNSLIKALAENHEFSRNIEERLQNFEQGIEILKRLKNEEDYFFLLLDKKITERALNRTVFYDEKRYMDNFQYQNFQQILQGIEDIKCEYNATKICVQTRYHIMENERISRIYQKLNERDLKTINELKELKIKMIDKALELKSKPEEPIHFNINYDNKITYKQCNDCGAWHNSAYNRCAPCNNFRAINDK